MAAPIHSTDQALLESFANVDFKKIAVTSQGNFVKKGFCGWVVQKLPNCWGFNFIKNWARQDYDVASVSTTLRTAIMNSMKDQAHLSQDQKADLHARVQANFNNNLVNELKRTDKADLRIDLDALQTQIQREQVQREAEQPAAPAAPSDTTPASVTPASPPSSVSAPPLAGTPQTRSDRASSEASTVARRRRESADARACREGQQFAKSKTQSVKV